jgi:hypothetical protein
MSRSLFLAALVTAVLPAQCTKLLGHNASASAEPASASASAPTPEPVPSPVTTATTPPVWHPPEPKLAPAASSAAPPPSPELLKARAAYDAKEWKRVRSILERKVRSGKGSSDEAQLLLDACAILKDKNCLAGIKSKFPALVAKPLGDDDSLTR